LQDPSTTCVVTRRRLALAIALFGLALVVDELTSGVVVLEIGVGTNLLGRECLGVLTRDGRRYSGTSRRERTVRLTRLVGCRGLFERIGGLSAPAKRSSVV
jgi:hypothetical protein